jgi:hypothetical protein
MLKSDYDCLLIMCYIFDYRLRDILLLLLAAFYPVRLVPLEDMSVETVTRPLEKTDLYTCLQIKGSRHGGTLPNQKLLTLL